MSPFVHRHPHPSLYPRPLHHNRYLLKHLSASHTGPPGNPEQWTDLRLFLTQEIVDVLVSPIVLVNRVGEHVQHAVQGFNGRKVRPKIIGFLWSWHTSLSNLVKRLMSLVWMRGQEVYRLFAARQLGTELTSGRTGSGDKNTGLQAQCSGGDRHILVDIHPKHQVYTQADVQVLLVRQHWWMMDRLHVCYNSNTYLGWGGGMGE